MKIINLQIKIIAVAVALTLLPVLSWSADLDDQEIINIEGLYKNDPSQQPVEVNEESRSRTTTLSTNKSPEDEVVKSPKADQKVEKLVDLNKLSPFREVSVIQKKYLPKTERFQLFGSAGTTTNSPWFLNLGVKINAGYYFTESLGVELSGVFLSNSERQVSKEIRDSNRLQPEKFVNTKSYMGADIVWAPIYGKLSMLNNQIIPFDMYFSFGGGTSSTNSVEGNVPTFHVGTGQIFAITKAIAFRWDYSWTMFQATPISDSSLAAAGAQKNTYNDLILTAGFSFFFPEAKYR